MMTGALSLSQKMMMKSALATILVSTAAVLKADAGALKLTILSMNDHHSNLDADDHDLTVSDATTKAVTGESVNVKLGGFPMTVAGMSALTTSEEAAGQSVIKLHAGDVLTGGAYYSWFKGTADAKMMQHACFHAMVIGNHEFDDGDQNLATFIDNLSDAAVCATGTKVLSANVVAGASSPLQTKYAKSHVFTLGGESVGVVGVTIKRKTMESSFPDAGTTVEDEKTAAQAEIDALVASGVDKIILLTHIGYAYDVSWMATLNNVDVIVGGDQHELLGDASDLMGFATPHAAFPAELTNGNGKKVCVVQSWEYSKTFGKLRVDFDANGDVTSCSGKPQFVYDSTSFLQNLVDAAGEDYTEAFDDAKKTAMVTHLDTLDNWHAVTADAATAASFETYKTQVDVLKTQKIADVPENICFERIPGQGRSTLCETSASYEHGGAACQLVAKGFLHRTKNADICVQNGGGCRQDISAGDFTKDDAYSMLPFSNTIVTMDMTGTQIIALMEDALDNALFGGSTGAYPYVAGLRMDVDMNKTKGFRVSNVEINSRLAGSWAAIDITKTYVVGTNNYIAAGKDGYLTFGEVTGVDSYMNYAQTMMDYAEEVKTLTAPAKAEMTTQSYIAPDGTAHTVVTPPASSGATIFGHAVALFAFVGAFAAVM